MWSIVCPLPLIQYSSPSQSVTFKTTSRNLARAMCMKNLKLTVVVVLVCLVCSKVYRKCQITVEFKYERLCKHSLMVLLLVLFECCVFEKQRTPSYNITQVYCIIHCCINGNMLSALQIILYIIVSAACGGLSWPSCV